MRTPAGTIRGNHSLKGCLHLTGQPTQRDGVVLFATTSGHCSTMGRLAVGEPTTQRDSWLGTTRRLEMESVPPGHTSSGSVSGQTASATCTFGPLWLPMDEYGQMAQFRIHCIYIDTEHRRYENGPEPWYWDIRDLTQNMPEALPGQNTPQPSLTSFLDHRFVFRLGFCYYDPSYGIRRETRDEYTDSVVGAWENTTFAPFSRWCPAEGSGIGFHWTEVPFGW